MTENRNIIRVLGIDLNTLKQILIEVNYKALDDFAEEERVIVFVRNQRKILVERIYGIERGVHNEFAEYGNVRMRCYGDVGELTLFHNERALIINNSCQ